MEPITIEEVKASISIYGFTVNSRSNITTQYGTEIVTISERRMYIVDTDTPAFRSLDLEVQKNLVTLAYRLACTPFMERSAAREMTVAEIEQELGYKVKVVK